MEGKVDKLAQKKCTNCGADFPIYERDRAFYAKIGDSFKGSLGFELPVPDPVECWDCRQQRRQAQRNERNLYRNKCDKCGKDMLTVFSPDKGAGKASAEGPDESLAESPAKAFPIYCSPCWWGDAWNPLDYGRDFDFGRPFFEQWKELFYAVPKLGLLTLGEMVNSDYVNDAYRLKNCYLVFDGEQGQDCMYGETFVKTKDCVEFLVGNKLELCYETVNCISCYNCRFLKFCNNCSESSFLVDCIGCKNCFACCNLRRAEFCIFNKKYEQSEYEKKMVEYALNVLGSYEGLQKFKGEFEKFVSTQPKRAYHGVKNEDVSGDCIDNCKDVYRSFDCVDSRDCSYCTNLEVSSNDCYDVDVWGENLSLIYNCECVGAGAQGLMCDYYSGMGSGNVFYSAFCWNGANDMLGCVAVQHKKFCIFNKQYEQSEYYELFGRIVEHMRNPAKAGQAGEWGQFFPISTSWFGYNETVAHEFYPITREEALAKGYNWKEKDSREFLKQKYVIPDRISDVPDSVCDEVLACGGGGEPGSEVGVAAGCGRNFKITAQELAYYRKFGVPVPRKCYNCRHMARRMSKNPRRLWERKCARSGVPILTSYSPDRPEEVLSVEEYVKEFF